MCVCVYLEVPVGDASRHHCFPGLGIPASGVVKGGVIKHHYLKAVQAFYHIIFRGE